MKRASGGLLDAEFDSSDEEDEDYVPEEGDDDDDDDEGGEKEEESESKVEEANLSSSAADIWAKLKAKTSSTAVATPAGGDAKQAEAKKPEEKKEPEKRTVTEVYDFAGEKVEFVVRLSSLCLSLLLHVVSHVHLILNRVTKTVTAEEAEKIEAKKAAAAAEKKNGPATVGASSSEKPDLVKKVGAAVTKPKIGGGGKLLAGVLGPKPKKMTTLQKSQLDWKAYREKNEDGLADSLDRAKKSGDGYLAQKAFLDRVNARQYELELSAKQRRK